MHTCYRILLQSTFLVFIIIKTTAQDVYQPLKPYEIPNTTDRGEYNSAILKQVYHTGDGDYDNIIHNIRLGLKPGETYWPMSFARKQFQRDSLLSVPAIKAIADSFSIVKNEVVRLRKEIIANSDQWDLSGFMQPFSEYKDSTFYPQLLMFLSAVETVYLDFVKAKYQKMVKSNHAIDKVDIKNWGITIKGFELQCRTARRLKQRLIDLLKHKEDVLMLTFAMLKETPKIGHRYKIVSPSGTWYEYKMFEYPPSSVYVLHENKGWDVHENAQRILSGK
jgi:hypothetical protein